MDYARKLKLHQHRTLAAYLALYCWIVKADALILPRSFLERVLMLERFKDARIKEIKADFSGYFDFVRNLVYSNNENKFATLIVSRSQIKELGAAMSDAERAKFLCSEGVITKVVAEDQDSDSVSFEKLASAMLSVSAGLMKPEDIPRLKLAN